MEVNTINSIQADIEMKLDSADEAAIIYGALRPEFQSSPSSRSTMTMHHQDNILYLKFKAKDVTSFRASINSSIRWIILSLDMLNL